MTADPRSPLSSDWREIASLGEQIVSAQSLAAQRDRIVGVASRLIRGQAALWLQESLFHLPNMSDIGLFSEEPELDGMVRAMKAGDVRTKRHRTPESASHGTWAAVPLEDQGMKLGAIQITRPKGPAFTHEELDLLKGLAGIIAVSLIASHRIAVERFRLNQLNLVREVSAQIANVMNVDELARRITELIQQTFHY